MQKLFKGKNNYKKFISDKEINLKQDCKHSQTLSTNQSKIHHQIDKQVQSHNCSENHQTIIHSNLNKYGTSNDLFYLTDFQDNFGRSRTRQKIHLKDLCNHKDQQILQQYNQKSQSSQELAELFEYYKYYINNPILYPKQHFKILYNFYQKKKYLQYKRLKAVLDLDDERMSDSENSMNQNISIDAKKNTKQNTKTFYIMNLIQTQFNDKHNQSQSKAFLELNHNLQEIINKNNFQNATTPLKHTYKEFFDKNSTLFKKKKTTPTQTNSYKNTIVKKVKKQSFHNSNSLKKIKFTKNSKQPYLSKFNIQGIQFNSKPKNELNSKKLRRASNLSMGQLQQKSNNFNIFSPKKYQKKRLNSCETIISKNHSKQKINDRKIKKHMVTELKFRQDRNEDSELQEFKSYLKKIQGTKYRKSLQRGTQSGLSSHSSKFKRQISPQKPQLIVQVKKVKKKLPLKNISAKNSLQKSPHKQSKKHLIEESIYNLKKKIRIAKQTIKNNNSTSNIHINNNKKERTLGNINKER